MNWIKGVDYPEWMDEASLSTLRKGYLLGEETPKEAMWEISCRVEDYLPGVHREGEISDKLFNYLWKGWICPSTPMWSNFRHKRGASISCFNVAVADSIPSIGFTLSEVMRMTQLGGGTSVYWGDVRARGSNISSGGKTNGTLSFIEIFDTMINKVSQGSSRRGACAVYLPIDHGDIEEFLSIKDNDSPIKSLFSGVCIPDSFITKLYDGDSYSLGIWARLLKSRSEKGLPYLFFTDNANNHYSTPEWYGYKQTNPDYFIKSSNLCIAGDQRVVTSKGYLKAEDLYKLNEDLTLFTGTESVQSSPMLLREENADIYEVLLSNGLKHKITSYHSLPVIDSNNKITKTPCSLLKIGDKVQVQINKGLFGTKDMQDEAFLLGLYQADGTQYKKFIMIDIWEKDFDLIDEIQTKFNNIHQKYKCDTYEIVNQNGPTGKFRHRKPARFRDCIVTQSSVKKKRLTSSTLHKVLNFTKNKIPDWIFEANEATQWQYLRGLYYGDGTISNSEKQNIHLSITSINKPFLEELLLLTYNLGLRGAIRSLRLAGVSSLPDGKGGHKDYNTKEVYRLIISNTNSALLFEKNTKFLSRKGVVLHPVARDNTKKGFKVVSITHVGKGPVYCPTLKNDEHIFISNGIRSFNCSEIFLPINEEESFVCCVLSVNLAKYDEWKDTDVVQFAIYLGDAVMSDFIQKTKSDKLMKRAYKFARDHRALGVGVLGWHTYLQSKNLPFASVSSKSLNNAIFKHIRSEAEIATKYLGQVLGPCKIGDGKRRNSTLLAIAPTTSNATIQGGVSPGIEPLASNYFIQKSAKGDFIRRNTYLEELLESLGKNTDEVWESIKKEDGSVHHLGFLTQDQKDVFKTFKEINQYAIIDQAADRQMFIDQGQSLNIFIPLDAEPKDVSKIHLYAHKRGLKGLYYQRGETIMNTSTASSNTLDDSCLFCQG